MTLVFDADPSSLEPPSTLPPLREVDRAVPVGPGAEARAKAGRRAEVACPPTAVFAVVDVSAVAFVSLAAGDGWSPLELLAPDPVPCGAGDPAATLVRPAAAPVVVGVGVVLTTLVSAHEQSAQ